MRPIGDQILSGQLVCPETKQRLIPSSDGSELVAENGARRYSVRQGVPVLLSKPRDPELAGESAGPMSEEYARTSLQQGRWLPALKRRLVRDYRSRGSLEAMEEVLGGLDSSALALSIGGGPGRAHPALCNLNLGAFLNVDVVGDAHQLPYANNCVDAVFCEAVLEHVRRPEAAVKEMERVLKPGGKVLSITPFLQAYHGYPDHYRNYTLTGHAALFEDAGFNVEKSGTCVGPVYTILNLISTFANRLSPRGLSSPLRKLWTLIAAPIHPMDRLFNDRADSHVLASTTFVVARKERASRSIPPAESS